MAISSFGFGGSNVHCLLAGAVRSASLPLRPLPPPRRVEAGPEPVEEETESAAPTFPPEVRSRVRMLAQRKAAVWGSTIHRGAAVARSLLL